MSVETVGTKMEGLCVVVSSVIAVCVARECSKHVRVVLWAVFRDGLCINCTGW